MPNKDRKGPNGEGACTGRKRGECAENGIKDAQAIENESFGKQDGNGRKLRGRGNGKRRCIVINK